MVPARSSVRQLTEPGEGLLPKNLNTRTVLEVNFGIQA
ncbi:hypothetical protein SBA2_90007 [Acidobacteriia bacterium SbA2]|nr:hypothetical protein SBA2_90007 [Acidobacteriia bacterium SbA2]